jgi:glucose/arabinose dehydrogenase
MDSLPLRLAISFTLLLGAPACGGGGSTTDPLPLPAPGDSTMPVVDRTVFVSGLNNPWDLVFLPNGELLFTERAGRLALRRTTGTVITVAQIADVVVGGEGGLLGVTIDPDFATNRFVYTCFSSRLSGTPDNRMVRWALSADGTQLGDRRDIVIGLPYANGGRHSGCTPRFGPDGQLWIGTGDVAIGTNPQGLRSLGGKVLRVTRDGAASSDNPVIAGADPRIYTYGHRNVQGIAFQPGTGAAYAIEQGPSFDDEVTKLLKGSNAGWNPVPGYNESVPMTDISKYPTAMRAFYATGTPARGTSGGGFLSGAAWKGWDGALVIGQLSGLRLMVLTFDASGALKTATPLFDNLSTRQRTPRQGPDGSLYVTTDAGSGNGQIWRVTPR